jgi:hypothetical protein
MEPAIVSTLFEQPTGAQRLSLERFIAERFWLAYGARVQHFCTHLLGLRDGAGRWLAAAGYTPASGAELFLERYLDLPIETLLGRVAGRAVARRHVVEVGNLAAGLGTSRELIPALGRELYEAGYRWVVFTATRELRNAFRRLRLEPLLLAAADAARLPDGGAAWGSYYAHSPLVVGGPIAACLSRQAA